MGDIALSTSNIDGVQHYKEGSQFNLLFLAHQPKSMPNVSINDKIVFKAGKFITHSASGTHPSSLRTGRHPWNIDHGWWALKVVWLIFAALYIFLLVSFGLWYFEWGLSVVAPPIIDYHSKIMMCSEQVYLGLPLKNLILEFSVVMSFGKSMSSWPQHHHGLS